VIAAIAAIAANVWNIGIDGGEVTATTTVLIYVQYGNKQ